MGCAQEEKEEMKEQQPKDNQSRHQDNLNHLHGQFYHNTYYENGVANPGARRREIARVIWQAKRGMRRIAKTGK